MDLDRVNHTGSTAVNRPQSAAPPPGLAGLARNTLWHVGGKWFQFVLAFLVNILIVRYLGPYLLGQLAYALSVVGILMLFGQVGADLYIRSELIQRPDLEHSIMCSTLFLRFVATAFVYLVVVGFSYVGNHSPSEIRLFLIAGLSLARCGPDVFRSYYTAHVRADLITLADLAAFSIATIVRLWAIHSEWGVEVFALASALEFVLPGLPLSYLYFKPRSHRFLSVSWKLACTILVKSGPLYISAIAIAMYLRVNQLMLQWLHNSEELGYFAAAVRVTERLYLIPVALGASFLPSIIAQKVGRDTSRYHANMQRFFDLNVACSYLVVILVVLTGSSVVIWALGEQFRPSVMILRIQVLSLPLIALGIARGQYVVAERSFRFAMFTNLSGVVACVLLNIMLVPAYGGVGAALSNLVIFGIVHIGSSFVYPPTRHWGPMQLQALLLPFRFHACRQLFRDTVNVLGRRKKE